MIAAIYARKSTDQTGVADEQKSVVTRQIDHARALCARKGWTVTEEHVCVTTAPSLRAGLVSCGS